MKNAICSFAVLALLLGSAQAQTKSGATQVAALLEKSGHKYTKVDDGVWQIVFKGKNTGEFAVRLALGGDVLVALTKIADRKDLKLPIPFLTKLLELNSSLDSVKLALSEEMLYLRMDTRLRVVDVDELNYILDQISGATDEMYPVLKPYLPQG